MTRDPPPLAYWFMEAPLAIMAGFCDVADALAADASAGLISTDTADPELATRYQTISTRCWLERVQPDAEAHAWADANFKNWVSRRPHVEWDA